MIFVACGMFSILSIGYLVIGIRKQGSWKYRSVRQVMIFLKRKGILIPQWMTKEVIFHTWITAIATSFLALIILMIKGTTETEISQILRPDYGQGSIQKEIQVEWEDENGEIEEEKIVLELEEKTLTSEEINNYFQQIEESLERIILGENETLEYVDHPLNLIEEIESIPAQIMWISSNTEFVHADGSLGREIPHGGEEVYLKANVQIQDEEKIYSFYVKVYPQKLSIKEQLEYWILQKNQKTESEVILPSQWNGLQLKWKQKEANNLIGIVSLLLCCPVFYLLKCQQDNKEKKKIIRDQLLLDYPRLLNKLTLLLNAGLNLRMSMERIGRDYEKYKEEGEYRVAYEEIIELSREMERGITEKEAYMRFGERCQILPYRTLTALLVQHLQKGGDDIQRILEEECKKAQETRIQQVKIMGEQASTKLLFPMILMLLIVFVIVLVPAWISFSV